MSIIEEHLKKVQFFETKHEQVDSLYDKILSLQHIRANIQYDDIFEQLNIDDQIHNLNEQLQQLNNNDENSYLLKVSDILGKYEKMTNNNRNTSENVKVCMLEDHVENNTEVLRRDSGPNTLQHFVKQRTHNNRGKLYTQYMSVVNNSLVQTTTMDQIDNNETRCAECNEIMQMSVNESYIVCNKCGEYCTYFEPTISGLTYEQEINTDTSMHFSYKRINHLRELLAQLQAKESSEIPENVIQGVRAEFKKSRVQHVSEITQEKVKQYLKKLCFNKYYEHTRQITNILTGKPPPTISNQLYEKLINMFIEIQEPFEKVCPKNRKNFFSYNYILFKFCELLDEKETMKLFPLLKSREKLYQQDCIWKDICKLQKWPFHKSV